MTHSASFINNKNVKIDHKNIFITAQCTIDAIEWNLINGSAIIDTAIIPKKAASRDLIPSLHDLFEKHHLKPTDLLAAFVNQGPAPFTTLRTLLATMNGLQKALAIPLIGIDGLQALMDEYHKTNTSTIALINAFNNEFYVGIKSNDTLIKTTTKAEHVLELIQPYLNTPHQFVGNGVALYQTIVPDVAISTAIAEKNTLAFLTRIGQEQYSSAMQIHELHPLYLKPHVIFGK